MAWREVGTDVALLPQSEAALSAASEMFKEDPGVAWDFLARGDEARVYEQIHVLDEDASQYDERWHLVAREFTCRLPAEPRFRPGEVVVMMARGERADFLGACLVTRVKRDSGASWSVDLATNGPFLVAPRRAQEVGRVVIGPVDM